jgi:P27 family predicted phage terminase small subunit
MAKKKVKFKMPSYITREEVKIVVEAIVAQVKEERELVATDLPNFHRLASSYNTYLDAESQIFSEGATQTNAKGDVVKHPAVNISREAWNEFLRILRELGITPKSKSQMGSHKPQEKGPDEPITQLF